MCSSSRWNSNPCCGGSAAGWSAQYRGRMRRPRSSATKRRSEEHTSELQSLMRISYAVFCLKKKKHKRTHERHDGVEFRQVSERTASRKEPHQSRVGIKLT